MMVSIIQKKVYIVYLKLHTDVYARRKIIKYKQ